MKIIVYAVFLVFVAVSQSFAGGLEVYVSFAKKNSPGLMAAESATKSVKVQAHSVGYLPDPVVSFAAANYPLNTFEMGDSPMTSNVFGVSQKILYPGKLSAARKTADLAGEAAEKSAQEYVLSLRRVVSDQFFHVAQKYESIEYVKAKVAAADALVELAQGKYEASKVRQADVLLAETERSALSVEMSKLEHDAQEALVRLNSLCGIEKTTPFRGLQASRYLSPVLGSSDLFALAKDKRPELAAQRIRLEQSKSQALEAELSNKPDFTVSASYSQRSPAGSDPGTDFVGLGFSMNLPVWEDRNAAKVASASAKVSQKRYELMEFERGLEEEIDAILVRLQSRRHSYELYLESLIPQAEKTYALFLAGYLSGTYRIEDVISSLKKVYQFQLQALAERDGYFKEYVALERLVGASVKDSNNG